MNLKALCQALYLIASCAIASAQTHTEVYGTSTDMQYGAAIQANVSVAQRRPMIRLVANIGVGVELAQFIYPAYNLQVQLYNGGIGTAFVVPEIWPLYFDCIHSFTATIGCGHPVQWMNGTDFAMRNSPLYYFHDFCYPALQNPFDYSLSVGTNFIQAYGPYRKRWQQVGYINAHVGPIQLAYTNDGTPFGKWHIGDGQDRYYTGSGFLAAHLPRNIAVNVVRATYQKFTGYTKYGFDAANALFLNDVVYQDTVQEYFNRSCYSLGAGNTQLGIYITGEFRNRYRKDMQHNIHRDGYYTLHQVPYRYAGGVSLSYFFSSANFNAVK